MNWLEKLGCKLEVVRTAYTARTEVRVRRPDSPTHHIFVADLPLMTTDEASTNQLLFWKLAEDAVAKGLMVPDFLALIEWFVTAHAGYGFTRTITKGSTRYTLFTEGKLVMGLVPVDITLREEKQILIDMLKDFFDD